MCAQESLGTCQGFERDPDLGSAVGRVQALLAAGRLPTVDEILLDETDELDFYERYSLRRMFFSFLAEEHGRRLSELLDEIRKQGEVPLDGRGVADGGHFTALVRDHASRTFARRYAKLDAEFTSWLQEFEPEWELPHRSLEVVGQGERRIWRSIAFPSSNAVAWRRGAVGSERFVISGEVEIEPAERQQLNLLLGRDGQGFVSIAFAAGYGVTVFDYRSEGSRWTRLASQPADLQAAQRVPFEVRVDGEHLRVSLNGEQLVSLASTGHDLSGPWGLGAQAGSAGHWHRLRAPGID